MQRVEVISVIEFTIIEVWLLEKQKRFIFICLSRIGLLTKNFTIFILSLVMSISLMSTLFGFNHQYGSHGLSFPSFYFMQRLFFSSPKESYTNDNQFLFFKDRIDLKEKDYYDFDPVGKSFGRIDISRVSELSKSEFETLILLSVPPSLKGKLNRYLKTALHYSEKYKVDPFWVLAVMWTESHFDQKAKSHVNARGLMQIMPLTGHFLAGLLNRPVRSVKSAVQLTRNPSINIEMGAFYLKKVLKDFRSNYRFATAAYNMGPGNVRKRLRRGLPVGTKNKYLNKVRRAYHFLIQGYRKSVLSVSDEYVKTFVIKNKRIETTVLLYWSQKDFWSLDTMPYRKIMDLAYFDNLFQGVKNTYIL